MEKLNKEFIEEEFDDLSFEEQYDYIRYQSTKKNNSTKKTLLLNAILKITTNSFIPINGIVNENGAVTPSDTKSKELMNIFINLKRELYGSQLVTNSYDEIMESDLESYEVTALARVEDTKVSSFKKFYNKIQDGYEYADWGGLSNEILFVEDWFKTYNSLKYKGLI